MSKFYSFFYWSVKIICFQNSVSMKKQVLAFTLLALPLAAASSVPTAKPEDVGISSERLQRVSQMIQRRIAAGEMTGAVAIVARSQEGVAAVKAELGGPAGKHHAFALDLMAKGRIAQLAEGLSSLGDLDIMRMLADLAKSN